MINTSCSHTPAGDATGSESLGTADRRTIRLAAGVISSVAAALAATTGLLALGGTAGAEALPTNALAPQVVMMANEAIASLDEFAVTGDPVDFLDYKEDRTETARLAAQQLGYGEVDMIRAWSSTPLDHQRAVLAAMTQVGVPYRSQHQPGRRRVRLFRPHHLRLGQGRRRAVPPERHADQRGGTARPDSPPRPATSSSTRAT